MTATDELRLMLDERGVEWTKPKSATEFIQTTFLCNGWGIEVLERNIGLCATATNAFDTPEQAIAATLGNDGVGGSNDGVAERERDQLKAESKKLREQLDVAEHNRTRNAREYARMCHENDKLRELVNDLYIWFVRGHDWGPYCAGETAMVEERMRELGVIE